MLRLSSRIGFKPSCFYNHALKNRLYRITSPTLVLWGGRDHMASRAHGETYAERIPNTKFAVISGAGHSAHAEKPEATAKLVLEFLTY